MQVKYREEYEKNKGKSMLEFVETPSYQFSKEAQKMQSEVGDWACCQKFNGYLGVFSLEKNQSVMAGV